MSGALQPQREPAEHFFRACTWAAGLLEGWHQEHRESMNDSGSASPRTFNITLYIGPTLSLWPVPSPQGLVQICDPLTTSPTFILHRDHGSHEKGTNLLHLKPPAAYTQCLQQDRLLYPFHVGSGSHSHPAFFGVISYGLSFLAPKFSMSCLHWILSVSFY